jgi:hypothetical protein
MISIKRNSNFSNWYQVFSFGKFIDELNARSQALELANHIAKQKKVNYINVEGEIVEVKKPVF